MRFGALLILHLALGSASSHSHQSVQFLATSVESQRRPLLPLSPRLLDSWGFKENCATELALEKTASEVLAQGVHDFWSAKWRDRLQISRPFEGSLDRNKLLCLAASIAAVLAVIVVGSCLRYTWLAKMSGGKENRTRHLSEDRVTWIAKQTSSGAEEEVDVCRTDVNFDHPDMWYDTAKHIDVDVEGEAVGPSTSEKSEFFDIGDEESEVGSTCSYFSKSDVQHTESCFSERSYSYSDSCDGLDAVCRACAELAPHMCRTCADSFQECASMAGEFPTEAGFLSPCTTRTVVEHPVIQTEPAVGINAPLVCNTAGTGQDDSMHQPSLPAITKHAEMQPDTAESTTLLCKGRRFHAAPPSLLPASRDHAKSSAVDNGESCEQDANAKQTSCFGQSSLGLFMETLGVAPSSARASNV